MSISPTEFVQHIRDECDYLRATSAELSREDYLGSRTHQRAFTRSLYVISACAARLPESYRKDTPGVEWSKLTAINERLIHDCFGADQELVWDVVSSHVPEIHSALNDLGA